MPDLHPVPGQAHGALTVRGGPQRLPGGAGGGVGGMGDLRAQVVQTRWDLAPDLPGARAWVKLGQPLLLSNLVDASNSSVPQHTQA